MTQKSAEEMYRNDPRFYSIVQNAVNEALIDWRKEYGPMDEPHAVRHVATGACIAALKLAFDNDAEITALRVERDAYRELIDRQSIMPRPMVLRDMPSETYGHRDGKPLTRPAGLGEVLSEALKGEKP